MIELVPRPDQYPQDWDAWPVQHSLDEAFKVSQEDYETLRCSISPVAHGFLHYTGILSRVAEPELPGAALFEPEPPRSGGSGSGKPLLPIRTTYD